MLVLQRLFSIGVFSSIALWITVFLWQGKPVWALAGPIILVAVYAALLGLEFHWLWRSKATDPDARPSPGAMVRAWLAEIWCGLVVFLVRQPFFSRSYSDLAPASGSGPGVLFVHGFFCNRGIWNPWMRRLRHLEIPHVAVNLVPMFGSIDDYVELVEASVARLERSTGTAPVVVAHSMGGLAVRAWLSRAGNGDRVHRVVTLGTPHGGTSLAHLARSTNGRQMTLGSEWLTGMLAREPSASHSRFTCFHSHCDNVVVPTASATLPGADNRHLEGTAHVQMVYHPEVLAEVLRLVQPVTSGHPIDVKDPPPTAGPRQATR